MATQRENGFSQSGVGTLPLLDPNAILPQLSSLQLSTPKVVQVVALWHCSRQTKLALDSDRSSSLLYQSCFRHGIEDGNPKGKHAQSITDEFDYDRCPLIDLLSRSNSLRVVGGDPNYPTICHQLLDSSKLRKPSR